MTERLRAMSKKLLKKFAFVAAPLVGLHVPPAEAEVQLGGHFKYQYSSTQYDRDDLLGSPGSRTLDDHEVDVRVNALGAWGGFEAHAEAEVLGVGGETFERSSRLPFISTQPSFIGTATINDDRRLFDLTEEIVSRDDYSLTARFDRLSIAYVKDDVVLRLGRQAISWGGGFTFHVFDLFNPFSPAAIDKDYKTGDDMLYGQWLAPSGADLQLLAVARREVVSGSLRADQSSFALKWRDALPEIDYELMLAQHYDELVLGVSLARTFLDAIWRIDLTGTDVEGESFAWSFVANIDRSFVIAERNVYFFIEYFHNDLGVAKSQYLALPSSLSERLERGELYTFGEEYLSLGVRVELSPRAEFGSSQFYNLHDESGYLQTRVQFDVFQDVVLLLGANTPFGARGSEFGGVALVPGGPFAGQDWSFFSRLSLYF